MIAVVRLRGRVRISRKVVYTFELLRLRRVNHCVVLKDSKEVRGMLNKVKDYATFGEVDDKLLKELVGRRGRKAGGKRLDKKDVTKMLKLLGEPKKLVEASFKPVFRLRPPKKGLKSKKKHFPQGDLGYRGKNINELLERMI
jgi:large subunit ribosomal protein L30